MPSECIKGIELGDAALSNVKGTNFAGRRVLHADSRLSPKQYVTYHNETWHGIVATWDVQGQKTFWCNYSTSARWIVLPVPCRRVGGGRWNATTNKIVAFT